MVNGLTVCDDCSVTVPFLLGLSDRPPLVTEVALSSCWCPQQLQIYTHAHSDIGGHVWRATSLPESQQLTYKNIQYYNFTFILMTNNCNYVAFAQLSLHKMIHYCSICSTALQNLTALTQTQNRMHLNIAYASPSLCPSLHQTAVNPPIHKGRYFVKPLLQFKATATDRNKLNASCRKVWVARRGAS